MATLFIGDLHLSEDLPYITKAFYQFLETQAHKAEALYILGDLFEVWLGDDVADDLALKAAEKLRAVSRYTPVYFINGNRDFLLSHRYARLAGMKILPEVDTINLYGKKTVILHGDTLCTLDEEYQKFRKLRNNPAVRWIFATMPGGIRGLIAKSVRNKSKKAGKSKSQMITDVTPSAVRRLMTETGSVQMIHGHTHRPGFNEVSSGRERIVVGDWYDEGSVLEISPEGARLTTLPF